MISREEENRLPVFKGGRDAILYFRGRFKDDFKADGTIDLGDDMIFCYTLNGQAIQIHKNGDVHIIY